MRGNARDLPASRWRATAAIVTVASVNAWTVHGVELPFGDEARSWWIDAERSIHDRPIADAEPLPGRYFLAGLADAHAHPALGQSPSGPVALDKQAARANLIAWANAGITLVRDTGSAAGLSLELGAEPGMPVLQAAGRFLAPAGRYFPDLLVTPVAESDLVSCALAEVSRGAQWVKLIADFPDLAAGTGPEPTYDLEVIAQLVAAVHAAGGRVAAHSTLPNAGQLVAAGVDSIEHGQGLDEAAVAEMSHRGTAWTPTLCAVAALPETPLPPERRQQRMEARERFAALLPLAVRLGVPVLAGTDVAGSIPREVALLAQLGLEPRQALAAASVWPRQFIGGVTRADIVTYDHDPREDPEQLRLPAAVVAGGVRLR
jgi:imidazolonepropionase-like amidohydrolase